MHNALPQSSSEITAVNAVEAHFEQMGMPTYTQAVDQISFLTVHEAGNFSVVIADADGSKMRMMVKMATKKAIGLLLPPARRSLPKRRGMVLLR